MDSTGMRGVRTARLTWGASNCQIAGEEGGCFILKTSRSDQRGPGSHFRSPVPYKREVNIEAWRQRSA